MITAHTVWILLVVTTTAVQSPWAVYVTLEQCDTHREILQTNLPATLRAECSPIELRNGS